MKRIALAVVCLVVGLIFFISAGRIASRPIGGFHSGNLLQNPSATTGSTTPWVSNGTTPSSQSPWTQWTVHNAAVTCTVNNQTSTVNSSNGSPWFENQSHINYPNGCSSNCVSDRHASISQLVLVPVSWRPFIQNGTAQLEYGGDAFAGSCSTGPLTNMIYVRHPDFEATLTVEFLDSHNHSLGQDVSGPIFGSPPFMCLGLPVTTRTKYGFLKAGVTIPVNTFKMQFTADFDNGFGVCNSNALANNALFTVGFDNLLLDIYR